MLEFVQHNLEICEKCKKLCVKRYLVLCIFLIFHDMSNELNIGICSICGLEGELKVVQEHFNNAHIINNWISDELNEDNLEDQEPIEDQNFSKKWKDNAIKLLLTLYQENIKLFQSGKKSNKSIWQIIARKMKEKNYDFTGDQCDLKFRNLKKTYKRIKDNQSQTGRGYQSWPYFDIFEEIFGNSADVNPTCLVSNRTDFKPHEQAGPSSSDSLGSATDEPPNEKKKITTTRKRESGEIEPEWIKKLRKDSETRHSEKMTLLKELIDVLKQPK